MHCFISTDSAAAMAGKRISQRVRGGGGGHGTVDGYANSSERTRSGPTLIGNDSLVTFHQHCKKCDQDWQDFPSTYMSETHETCVPNYHQIPYYRATWHRKWRETKQQPSRARSGHHSCCLVSLHFLCDSSIRSPCTLVAEVRKGGSGALRFPTTVTFCRHRRRRGRRASVRHVRPPSSL